MPVTLANYANLKTDVVDMKDEKLMAESIMFMFDLDDAM